VAGYFREKRADFTFRHSGSRRLRFRHGTHLFEVMFCKSGSLRNEYWKVFIELDDDGRALLTSSRSAELGTRAVVRRSGILDLLPASPDDSWQRFGTVLEENVMDTWHGGSDPIIAKGDHKVWIIPGV
jgi:hypothetical protein